MNGVRITDKRVPDMRLIDRGYLDSYLVGQGGSRPSIFIDVDNTIRSFTGHLNELLIEEIKDLRREYCDKISIVVWSAGGQDHAKDVVELAGLTDEVDTILAKPLFVIDDTVSTDTFGFLLGAGTQFVMPWREKPPWLEVPIIGAPKEPEDECPEPPEK